MKVDEPFCLLDPMGSDDFDSAEEKFKIDPLPSTERLAIAAKTYLSPLFRTE